MHRAELLVVWLFVCSLPAVCGQFPLSCPSANRECCPLASNGQRCGGVARGACTNVAVFCNQTGIAGYGEFLGWATGSYDRVCVCQSPFDGPACDECVSGRTGPTCTTVVSVVRKPLQALSTAELSDYVQALLVAKATPSNFSIAGGPPVSVYDYFAWEHYFTMTAELSVYVDYAHEGSGFPTWHRRYLLQFERALQQLVNDPTLAIPYWDWTAYNATANGVAYDPLLDTVFGGDGHNDGSCRAGTVSAVAGGCNCTLTAGSFRGWLPVGAYGRACNAGGNCGPGVTAHLTRGIGCDPSTPNTPGAATIDWLVTNPTFDVAPYNSAVQSFRNQLEGFALTPLPTLPDNTAIGHGRDVHNRVHVYIGGTMAQVPAAANDPIFWSHHAFIDLIFERWLRNNAASSGPPASGAPIGHNLNECLAPFLPLVTHSQFFTRSTNLGYDYSYFPPPSAGFRFAVPSTTVLITLLAAVTGNVALWS